MCVVSIKPICRAIVLSACLRHSPFSDSPSPSVVPAPGHSTDVTDMSAAVSNAASALGLIYMRPVLRAAYAVWAHRLQTSAAPPPFRTHNPSAPTKAIRHMPSSAYSSRAFRGASSGVPSRERPPLGGTTQRLDRDSSYVQERYAQPARNIVRIWAGRAHVALFDRVDRRLGTGTFFHRPTMPVPTAVQHEKNIWVAAGDGDLDRVRELIEVHSTSPNAPDPNTYTPMHAAASYGHLNILEYLISRGGDVNVTDNDGDTPLYVVENVETARFLVEHGAAINRQNDEGITPAQYLEEDFPAVAAYLEGLGGGAEEAGEGAAPVEMLEQPSQHAQNAASENLTSSLLQSVHDVMRRAEAEGREASEDELRQVVGRAVLEGVATGYGMGTEGAPGREERDGDEAKRPRTEGS